MVCDWHESGGDIGKAGLTKLTIPTRYMRSHIMGTLSIDDEWDDDDLPEVAEAT